MAALTQAYVTLATRGSGAARAVAQSSAGPSPQSSL